MQAIATVVGRLSLAYEESANHLTRTRTGSAGTRQIASRLQPVSEVYVSGII